MQVENSEGTTIRGKIQLAPDAPEFRDANLIVWLEGITAEGAPSKDVAQLVLYGITGGGPRSEPIQFAFGQFKAAPNFDYYNVSAHVDLNRNGTRDPGDFFSGKRYRVLSNENLAGPGVSRRLTYEPAPRAQEKSDALKRLTVEELTVEVQLMR